MKIRHIFQNKSLQISLVGLLHFIIVGYCKFDDVEFDHVDSGEFVELVFFILVTFFFSDDVFN